MFRRRSDGAADSTAEDDPADTSTETPAAEAKKGRPTPKRREAEAGRYQPIGGSSARRPAGPRTAADKARDKSERARKLDAMKKGEDWALNARDKGPVKAFIRDYIDSRRYVSEYALVFLAVLLVGIVTTSGRTKSGLATFWLDGVMVFLLGAIIIQGFFIRGMLRREIPKRFPDSRTAGLTWYAMARSMQMRRMRMPQPRVERGAKV